MRARNRLLEHALAEIQGEYERLEVRFEKVTRENATLRAKVKELEAELAKYRPTRPPEDRP